MVFMDGHSNRKAETPQGPGTARLSDVTERSGGETDPVWWGLGGGVLPGCGSSGSRVSSPLNSWDAPGPY